MDKGVEQSNEGEPLHIEDDDDDNVYVSFFSVSHSWNEERYLQVN